MSDQLSFEDEYFEVLQSIEHNIYEVYNSNHDIVDYNVNKVLNGLVRTLENKKRDRKPPRLKLKGDEQRIYDKLYSLAQLFTGEDDTFSELIDEPLTYDEMIACFKRIQRSIKLMSDQGRQGYLNFIKQFFGD